jgi:hypothetical protein
VTPEYEAPFRFTGGTIDKVIVDLSGEPYLDHEAQVRAWFMRDSQLFAITSSRVPEEVRFSD